MYRSHGELLLLACTEAHVGKLVMSPLTRVVWLSCMALHVTAKNSVSRVMLKVCDSCSSVILFNVLEALLYVSS